MDTKKPATNPLIPTMSVKDMLAFQPSKEAMREALNIQDMDGPHAGNNIPAHPGPGPHARPGQ